MATSADRDDRDKHDDDEETESTEREGSDHEDDADAAKAPPAKKPLSKPSAKAAAVAEADDEDDDDDEEEAPRPAKKAAPARGPGKGRGPGAARAKKAPPPQGGSLGKSVLLFFVIVIGLGAGFAILGREPTAEQAKPKWTVGQTVDVEVTLVRSDRQDLACAAADEVGGKHCAFEAANKAWSKGGDPNDDKVTLKPYTTTDRMQFVAAGLWSDPGLSPDKLPATRFSAKCKLKVEGTMKNVGVRWEQTGQWYPQDGWFAGSISSCSLN
jgi:hypothetical protein